MNSLQNLCLLIYLATREYPVNAQGQQTHFDQVSPYQIHLSSLNAHFCVIIARLFKGETKFGKSGRVWTLSLKFWIDLVYDMSGLLQSALRFAVSKLAEILFYRNGDTILQLRQPLQYLGKMTL